MKMQLYISTNVHIMENVPVNVKLYVYNVYIYIIYIHIIIYIFVSLPILPGCICDPKWPAVETAMCLAYRQWNTPPTQKQWKVKV